jgi:NAD(P)-dependent dehydrogenase (short-subunit alcohol dehydrogenase family)
MKGKSVALVTGAGSGIGKAAALALAGEGHAVAILGHTADENRQTAELIRDAGGDVVALDADVANEDEMRLAFAKLIDTFGRLDIVVANAGINGTWAPIDDLRPVEFDRTVAVNLRGTYLTLHLAVPHLKSAGGGSIVVIASINGTRTFTSPGATAYSATKAAQVAMVQQLAVELGRHHIRVNAICPGRIETSIADNTDVRAREETQMPVEWPEGDIPLTGEDSGTSRQVADAIVFLASDKAQHISGSPLFIDGGQGLLR